MENNQQSRTLVDRFKQHKSSARSNTSSTQKLPPELTEGMTNGERCRVRLCSALVALRSEGKKEKETSLVLYHGIKTNFSFYFSCRSGPPETSGTASLQHTVRPPHRSEFSKYLPQQKVDGTLPPSMYYYG